VVPSVNSPTAAGPALRRTGSVVHTLVASARRIPAYLTYPRFRRRAATAVAVDRPGHGDCMVDEAWVTTPAAAMDCCLASRCLWCREPIGWSTCVRVWTHLPAGRLRCARIACGRATADPDLIIRAPTRAS